MPSWVRWGTRFLALIPCLWCSAVHAGTFAYIVGSNDARIARVDLDTGTVTPSVAVAGSFPNRIEVGPGGRLAAVANSGSDDVTLVQLRTGTVLGTVALPPGTNPWAVEIVGRRVFVTGLLTDRVVEIDAATGTVVRSVPVGRAPEGMAVSAGKLYVANTGFDFQTFSYDPGSVTVLDLEGLAPVAVVPVSLNPQDCVRGPDGSVHVICTGDFFQVTGAVDVLDPEQDVVVGSLPVAGGFPGGGAIGRDGAAYLNVTTPSFGSEVWSYDARTLAFLHDGDDPLLPSFDFFGALALAPDGRLLVPDFSADLLLVEDPAAPGAPRAYLVGDGPIGIAVVEHPGSADAPDAVAGLLAAAGERTATRIAFASVTPNPSRGAVELAVRAPDGDAATVTLFDVNGRRVRALDRRVASGGGAVFRWDGRSEDGAEAGAGVYFARAESGSGTAVVRVLRLR
jgi:YVTN family beta-propeller protein